MTKDYCDVAVNTDIKILGFSDHGPLPNSFYNLGDGYDESRMDFEVLKNEYLPDFEKSKEEFKDELILEKGLEMEYVPGHDDYYQNLLDYVDYLILGEHWIKDPFNDSGRLYYSKLDYSNVMYYAKDVEKALDSKLFKIIAHPDIFLSNYVSKNGIMRELDEEAYKAMELIVDACVRNDCLIEFNLNGITRGKYYNKYNDSFDYTYPRIEFFDIVVKKGGKVIFGCDAHDPFRLNHNLLERGIIECIKLGIRPINIKDR
ncbi:MAG: hypothetical protein IJS58_03185 [Bacilli bacterium]|nr:hypothetical protein [Bacilli bacterium]